MNTSNDILTVLLLSTIAQSSGTDLATNNNFLLLLLLGLSNSGCNSCNSCNSCGFNGCNSCGFNNGCSSCGRVIF